jgi:hypothetical protein
MAQTAFPQGSRPSQKQPPSQPALRNPPGLHFPRATHPFPAHTIPLVANAMPSRGPRRKPDLFPARHTSHFHTRDYRTCPSRTTATQVNSARPPNASLAT